jgi:alkylation response protein AidB-like acyl-CoA dehydrogenase
MSEDFAQELKLMADSVDRLLSDEHAFDKRAKRLESPHGFLAADWKSFASLGWLGVSLPESVGGMGAGVQSAAVLSEQFGKHLLVGPFVSSIQLGAGIVCLAGDANQCARWVEPTVAGESHLALAWAEPAGRFDLHHVEASATAMQDGFRLSGRKVGVLFGGLADWIIVSARTSGARRDEPGVGLFVVPADAVGVTIHSYRTHDGASSAVVELNNVHVPTDCVLGDPGDGLKVLEQVADQTRAVLCADAVGAMWAVHNRTLEYLKIREQFGSALGKFQALQHRMVDAYMHCELAQSMVTSAVSSANLPDAAARASGVSAASFKIGRSARAVCEEGIQMHGGMGMMAEMPIGHYLKRVTIMGSLLGDTAWHLRRYANLSVQHEQ